MMRQRRGASPTVADENFADDGSLQYDILKSRKRFQQKVALLQQSLSRRREERSASDASSLGAGAHGLSHSRDQASRGTTSGPSTSPVHRNPTITATLRYQDPASLEVEQQLQYRLSPSPVPVRGALGQRQEYQHSAQSASFPRTARSASMLATPLFTEHSPPPVAQVNPRALVDEDEAGFLEPNCFTGSRPRTSHNTRSMSAAVTPHYLGREVAHHHVFEQQNPSPPPLRSNLVPELRSSPQYETQSTSRQFQRARENSRSPLPEQAMRVAALGMMSFEAPAPRSSMRSPVRKPFVKEMSDFPLAMSPNRITVDEQLQHARTYVPASQNNAAEAKSHSRPPTTTQPLEKAHSRHPSEERFGMRSLMMQPLRQESPQPLNNSASRHHIAGSTEHNAGRNHNNKEPVFCLRPPLISNDKKKNHHIAVATEHNPAGRNHNNKEPVFCLRPPLISNDRLDSIRRQREEQAAKVNKREAAAMLRMDSRRREAEAKHQQRLLAQRQALKKIPRRTVAADRGLVAVRSRSVSAHSMMSSHDSMVSRSVSPQTRRPSPKGSELQSLPHYHHLALESQQSTHRRPESGSQRISQDRSASIVADRMASTYRAQTVAHVQQLTHRDATAIVADVEAEVRPPPPRGPTRRSISADTAVKSFVTTGIRLTAPRLEAPSTAAPIDDARCHTQLLAPSESPNRQEWVTQEARPSQSPNSNSTVQREQSQPHYQSPQGETLLHHHASSSPPPTNTYLSPESLKAHNALVSGRPRRSKSWDNNGTVDVQQQQQQPQLISVEQSRQTSPAKVSVTHPSFLQSRSVNSPTFPITFADPQGVGNTTLSATRPYQQHDTQLPPKKRFTLRSLYGNHAEDEPMGLGTPIQQTRGGVPHWPPISAHQPNSTHGQETMSSSFATCNDDNDAEDMMQRIANMRRMMATQ
ncbi:Hypothetical protein, putative [Bodo saltans]|uniref:Uncharacterized protein n=2 Tax=Bodo saltans TaxID=75058 RepID=A0A0S4J702_BODSA|nr:Hypothetical protein, putative [Bodo saltans]|eukprot:CUG86138.1 Hypothetical protein, putative [Bodo saltans]